MGSPDRVGDREKWLDRRLAEVGMRRTGPVTCPHDRPWGTVHTAPTTGGPVWLKAPCPATVFEVALYELLEKVVPARIPRPIAVDHDRGWVLLPDGGATLGDQVDDAELADVLVVVLPQYAQLQRDLAPHVTELLSFGVADMRPAIMPGRFDEALAVVEERAGRQLHAVREMRATFVGWCERLAASRVGASLDHNDLHPWNVFFDAGQARFYDWGDSVVAHPFASMLLVLAVVRMRLGVGPDDPAVTRPRDAYLEVWSDLASRAELVAEQELACWVGKVARSLTWDRALRMQGHDQAGEYAEAPLQNLTALLADSWSDLRAGA
jgi:Phosphotransferase enzyme family